MKHTEKVGDEKDFILAAVKNDLFLVTPRLTVNGHRVDLREAVKKTFLEDFAR